jgi:hypothetical protein
MSFELLLKFYISLILLLWKKTNYGYINIFYKGAINTCVHVSNIDIPPIILAQFALHVAKAKRAPEHLFWRGFHRLLVLKAMPGQIVD